MSALAPSAKLDLAFQALADPARRGMVEQLCRGPASVSALAKPLSMTLSAVVQHLQVLESSGLVRTRKAGRVRTCQIDPTALRNAEHWLTARRTHWERRLDRLGEYLDEQDARALAVPSKQTNSTVASDTLMRAAPSAGRARARRRLGAQRA